MQRKRIEQLMRSAALSGDLPQSAARLHRLRPYGQPHPDLVNPKFTTDAPDRLWLTDVTQHRTGQGRHYCAVVLDVYSRQVWWTVHRRPSVHKLSSKPSAWPGGAIAAA